MTINPLPGSRKTNPIQTQFKPNLSRRSPERSRIPPPPGIFIRHAHLLPAIGTAKLDHDPPFSAFTGHRSRNACPTASMPKDPISLSQLLGQFGTLQKTFRQQLEVFHHLREKHIIRRSSREANCIYDPFLPLIAVEKPYNALMTANDALSEYLI